MNEISIIYIMVELNLRFLWSVQLAALHPSHVLAHAARKLTKTKHHPNIGWVGCQWGVQEEEAGGGQGERGEEEPTKTV